MFWYQINPYYFLQVVNKKSLPGSGEDLSFYNLVSKNINRIVEMKCDGIWIMPLYIRGEKNRKGNGSPYAVKDYKMDSIFGTEQELIDLIKACHKNNLQVITEYIPNHLSQDAVFIEEHPECAYTDENGSFLYDQDWSDTVKLKHREPLVQEFTRNNMKNILGKFDFDGFRIDMAHCPYYDIDGKAFQGEWDSQFWENVFNDEFFKKKKYTFLAEVYDDRNHEYSGYGDPIRLIKNGMTVYDKKVHDLFAHKLKNFEFFEPFQETFYRELFFQYEALKVADIKNYINPPFLRIPTNHDDNPGIGNFGGVLEYNIAFTLQTLMTGHSMIYNGDEFGLSIKLSRILENVYDANNNLVETKDVYFLPQEDEEIIYKNVLKTLDIRNNLISSKHKLYISRILDKEGNLSNDLVGFIYVAKGLKEITLIVANLSKNDDIIWGSMKDFYPSLDKDLIQKTWLELLQFAGIQDKIIVSDIYNNIKYEERYSEEDFWVGIKGLGVQILKIKSV